MWLCFTEFFRGTIPSMFTRSWDNNDDVNNLRKFPVAAKLHFPRTFFLKSLFIIKDGNNESWVNTPHWPSIWIRGLETFLGVLLNVWIKAATGHKGILHEWKGICVYYRSHLSYSQASLTRIFASPRLSRGSGWDTGKLFRVILFRSWEMTTRIQMTKMFCKL